ncbi:MAG: YIP1 family protein [Acidobacteria bacterium]|nr:YIP1 family protein [Acidobacteriota bacterium]
MSEPEQPGVPPRIELDPHPEPPKPAFNPYQPPMAARLEPPPSFDTTGGFRPVPWEDEEAFPGVLDRWFATIRLGFTAPMDLSDRVPVTSPMMPAWLFFLVMGIPASVLSLMTKEMTRQFMASFLHTAANRNMGLELVAIAIGLIAGPFISGAFLHLFLWMWGGTKEGIGVEQTIRFVCYAYGVYYLVGWIPLLNIPLGIVFWVFLSMGIARVHRTDTWRGFAAMLTPLGICCCFAIASVLMFKMWS